MIKSQKTSLPPSHTKPRTSKKPKVKPLTSTIIALIILAISILLIIYREPLIRIFDSRDRIQELVQQAGIFAPLLFVFLQIIQVVIAPIPGQITGLVGGYLFGPLGIVLSLIGASIGFVIVFLISRRFGRPLIEKIFNQKLIKKFDYITEDSGPLIFFLIFLLPTFPDDLICYLAGLTRIPTRKLTIIAITGRFPSLLALNLVGSGLSRDTIRPIIVATFLFMLIMVIAYLKREWLHHFVQSRNRLDFIKSTWTLNLRQTILLITTIILLLAISYLAAFFNFSDYF